MRIVDVRERTVPIHSSLRNAVIDFGQMTVSLLALISDVQRDGQPLVGFGFNSNGRYAQGGLLRERFIPRLLATPEGMLLDESGTLDPARVFKALVTNEKPGGHGERSVAVGIIDMAAWDLCAKHAGRPLYRLLADRYHGGIAQDRVAVYAAGGYYYPGKDRGALQDEMRRYLDQGYTSVKMKIGGAPLSEDLARIEAVIDVVGRADGVAVDANGRFGEEEARTYARALEPYGVRWFEEPGDPLDFALQAELGSLYPHPMATGENLFSMPDVRNLVRYAAMRPDRDLLQMDPALSYGLIEYLRMIEVIETQGWSRRSLIPHGGHQMALSIAAGLGLGGNESYPGVFQPFGGFADKIPVDSGFVRLPDSPGIGLEEKGSLAPLLRELQCE